MQHCAKEKFVMIAKPIITAAFFLVVNASVSAQSTIGITGKQDTSYTLYSAYNSIKKAHPEATLVPEQKDASVKEKRNISYCRISKRDLLLDVFYPAKKSAANGVAIVIIHGGGWRSGSRSQHYALAQHLAARGYVCFTPEYRLSTEALYPAALHDVKAALRWVHKKGKKWGINKNKIAVAGFSAGGQLAALAGTTTGNKNFEGKGCNQHSSSAVAAIIDLDGTLSFTHRESGEGDDSKKPSAATLWFGYSKKDSIELWNEASPLTHAGSSTPPTLFINSSVARMHAGRDDYITLLQQHSIYTEVHSFENAPHHFPFFNPWFGPMINYIDAFLKKVFALNNASFSPSSDK